MDYLENWSVLNDNLHSLSEEETYKLLRKEMKDQQRAQFLIRLYGRYNTLRTKRERKEVMAGTWQGK